MTLSFPTLVLMQCSWQLQVCVEFFVAASVADINSSMLLVLWQGHISERIYQLSHSSISISWVLAVSLLFSNSPNYDTVFRRFSMCFSSKSPQILRKTGHANGPICVLALCQSLPTLALGFVWWLPLAGRSAVIVTLTECPLSLVLLFLADLEDRLRINPSDPRGKPLPTTCPPPGQQIIQFYISSGSVGWPQRSCNQVGPARVRETTQPLTDLNTIAFKSIKLQVCYATPAKGDNCHNSKVIFCFQILISIRVLSPGDHSGCMPGAEFIQQSVTDVAVTFSFFSPPH